MAEAGGYWVKTEDQRTGRTYWANPVTQQSSWERPADYMSESDSGSSESDSMGGPGVHHHHGGGDDDISSSSDSDDESMYDESSYAGGYSDTTGSQMSGHPGAAAHPHAAAMMQPHHHMAPQQGGYRPGAQMANGGAFGGAPMHHAQQQQQQQQHHHHHAQQQQQQHQHGGDPQFFMPRQPTVQERTVFTAEQYSNRPTPPELLIYDDDHEQYFSRMAEHQGARFQLPKYGETYFEKQRKTIFGNKYSLAEMLAWVPGNKLKEPLRKFDDEKLRNQALQCFKNITGYMKDRKTSKPPKGHVYKLTSIGIQGPEDLRDEIYCLLCKQTTNNPRDDSVMRGWELMAIVLGIFPPSEEFACYLSAFLYQTSLTEGRKGKLAAFCLRRLDKCMQEGARKMPPTDKEMDNVPRIQPIPIKVELPDGEVRELKVESQTTVRQVLKALVEDMALGAPEAFSLAEMETPRDDLPEKEIARERQALKDAEESRMPHSVLRDRMIDPDDRVMDIHSQWQKEAFETPTERHEYKIVLKFRLIFRDDLEALPPPARRLLFAQTAGDVVRGFFPGLSEKDALELGSLQLQALFGVNETHFYSEGLLRERLHYFVPRAFRAKRDETFLSAKLLADHEKVVELSREEAEDLYTSKTLSFQSFGATFFAVLKMARQKKAKVPCEHFIIGISERGVLMLDPITKDIKEEFELSEILTYGFKEKTFLLVAGNLMQQRKFHFRTAQGREMHDLMRTYIQRLVSKQRAAAGQAE